MTWTQLINNRIRRVLQDDTSAFVSDEKTKIMGLECQREIADRAWVLFPTERTFALVASQEMYTFDASIGPDAFALKRMMYGTATDIYPMNADGKPEIGQSSQPTNFFIRNGNIGFYPTPSAIATITAWGFRTPPMETMTIIHDGSASATAASATVASNVLTLAITGGANAGSDTFDLTAAANDTVSELVTLINALAKGFTATRPKDVYSGELTANFEDITGSSCFQTTLNMYQNPQAPPFTHRHIVNGMLMKAWEEQGEFKKAEIYEKKWTDGLREIEFAANQQVNSFKLGHIQDVYGGAPGNVFQLPGGWFVRVP